ncbi:SKI family transcriptional corepressor 2 [Bacillus rossius redtenbacheri]|uniref:SKI family transcriptional corepressor 2 n=1 Tax=Bacillus rossius redtenbacheri TaxID=93214 RepID=UPI002FDCADD4
MSLLHLVAHTSLAVQLLLSGSSLPSGTLLSPSLSPAPPMSMVHHPLGSLQLLTLLSMRNMASESPEPPGDAARRSPGDRPPPGGQPQLAAVPNQVGSVLLYGVPIVSLVIDGQERLCLAQISNTLLKEFSYNEIHNRRVALGITCVQCTPVQLEILRRAGAMPVSSRRCGMITRREAERLCKSFLGDNSPPRLPDDFAFAVHHECAWGCRGAFLPARYNSSRAKCIRCAHCGLFFSPNKFIFHSHRASPAARYVQPDAANFNSWRRHMRLSGSPPEQVVHAWEDVKAMFNGGTRKRLLASSSSSSASPAKLAKPAPGSPPPALPPPPPPRVPPFPDLLVDYVWQHGVKAHHLPFPPWPWLGKRVAAPLLPPPLPPPAADLGRLYPSAFRPVLPAASVPAPDSDEETVDVESTEDDPPPPARPASPGAQRGGEKALSLPGELSSQQPSVYPLPYVAPA